MSVVSAIRQLTGGVEAARDRRLEERRALLEARVPPRPARTFAKDCHCHDCRTAAAEATAHADAAHVQSRRLAVLEHEIRDTRPGVLRDLERWLQKAFDEHRGRRVEVQIVRSGRGQLRAAKSNAAWLERTARTLVEAQREVRDELVFVPSRELPGRLAEVRARVAALLDQADTDAQFEPMSEYALFLHFGEKIQ